jgi:hypothetical protein
MIIYKKNQINKHYKNYAFILFFVLLIQSFLFATESSNQTSAGTTYFQYLKMDVGARTLGMGGAFTGVADDISAMRYNPAGLRLLIKPELSATHMEWIDDLRVESLSYGRPYGLSNAIGFNVFYMTTGDAIIGRDDNGHRTDVLKYEQMYATLGWATRLDRYDNFLFGVNLKYANEVLAYSVNSVATLDAGLLFKLYNDWNLGLCARNIGFEAEPKEELPLETRVGLSCLKRNVGLSIDAYKFTDTEVRYATGLELFIKEIFVLRAGYNSSLNNLGKITEDESLSSLSKYSVSGLSLGFGILTKPIGFLGGYSIKCDYAIVDYGRLGFNHIFSFSTEF